MRRTEPSGRRSGEAISAQPPPRQRSVALSCRTAQGSARGREDLHAQRNTKLSRWWILAMLIPCVQTFLRVRTRGRSRRPSGVTRAFMARPQGGGSGHPRGAGGLRIRGGNCGRPSGPRAGIGLGWKGRVFSSKFGKSSPNRSQSPPFSARPAFPVPPYPTMMRSARAGGRPGRRRLRGAVWATPPSRFTLHAPTVHDPRIGGTTHASVDGPSHGPQFSQAEVLSDDTSLWQVRW
jgi:hypothetical protein